jgi:hypothetical protein
MKAAACRWFGLQLENDDLVVRACLTKKSLGSFDARIPVLYVSQGATSLGGDSTGKGG